jgi:hypothetical protein
MLAYLPPSAFAPFSARRIVGAELAWRNPQLPLSSPERYAYAIPAEADPEGMYTTEEKTFLAERYGGKGTVNNGGGVRCGIDGDVQVKGIGRNGLAGKSPVFWYSHGGATLEEGIREAIWGEVCCIALPHGGVRAYAVLATQTTCPFPGADGTVEQLPRGLILREAVLRPAHYLPQPYYEPTDDIAQRYPSDGARTKAAVLAFGKGLSTVLGEPPASGFDVDYLNRGLREMIRRFAEQHAAARAKKIMHGTVGCSNISLDGRWLDYGTISTLSDYGPVITGFRQPDFWNEPTALAPTLQNLVYYVGKWLSVDAGPGLLSYLDVAASYTRIYEERLRLEFLKLTGLPERWLAKAEEPVRERLYRVMREINARGNREPFKYSRERLDLPDKFGAYHLNTILKKVCRHADPAAADAAVRGMLDDASLRARFIAAYFALRAQSLTLARAAGVDPAGLMLSASVDAGRRNRSVASLHRWNLLARVNALLADGIDETAVAVLIQSVVDEAAVVFGEPGPDGTLLDIDRRRDQSTYLREDGTAVVKRGDATRELGRTELLSGAVPGLVAFNHESVAGYASKLS